VSALAGNGVSAPIASSTSAESRRRTDLCQSLQRPAWGIGEYAKAAAKTVPSLASERVTPHRFRNATAVHLVAAGVDVTVIRSWLGHVSLDTTNHYAQANLETKRKALERLEDWSRPSKPPPWKRDASVLAWLDTL
jgi:integrase